MSCLGEHPSSNIPMTKSKVELRVIKKCYRMKQFECYKYFLLSEYCPPASPHLAPPPAPPSSSYPLSPSSPSWTSSNIWSISTHSEPLVTCILFMSIITFPSVRPFAFEPMTFDILTIFISCCWRKHFVAINRVSWNSFPVLRKYRDHDEAWKFLCILLNLHCILMW